jgi:hypothetical protein
MMKRNLQIHDLIFYESNIHATVQRNVFFERKIVQTVAFWIYKNLHICLHENPLQRHNPH